MMGAGGYMGWNLLMAVRFPMPMNAVAIIGTVRLY
jgi:hypothetical protein